MKTQQIQLTLFSFLLSCTPFLNYAQKAHEINRQRKYDEISWLINHNAYNNRVDGPRGFFGCFGGGNQSEGIQKQLQDGVRNFMVDIYRVNGELRLKHGTPNMCMMDAKAFNNIIADWLNNHPLDIITLHIESGPNLGKSGLDDIFYGRRSGYKNVSSYIYNHNTFVSTSRPRGSGSDVYPTIQEMLDQKKQLVIFTERNYNSDLYRYEFTHTAQNPYRAGQVNQLFDVDKFTVHRGIDHKTILTVNHFAGDAPTYNGDVNKSKDANQSIRQKALLAWQMFGHRPSIAVDYYNFSYDRKALPQIIEINKINEVRGKFSDVNDVKKHIKDVKAYLAEFKNGKWQKIKNIEHRGKRASWNLFYSFPAQKNDTRAVFFEHSDYNFSPPFIKLSDYDGNNSLTFVKNIKAITKRKSQAKSRGSSLNEGEKISVSSNPINTLEKRIELLYHVKNNTDIFLKLYDLTGKLIITFPVKTLIPNVDKMNIFFTKNLKGAYILKGQTSNFEFSKKVLFI